MCAAGVGGAGDARGHQPQGPPLLSPAVRRSFKRVLQGKQAGRPSAWSVDPPCDSGSLSGVPLVCLSSTHSVACTKKQILLPSQHWMYSFHYSPYPSPPTLSPQPPPLTPTLTPYSLPDLLPNPLIPRPPSPCACPCCTWSTTRAQQTSSTRTSSSPSRQTPAPPSPLPSFLCRWADGQKSGWAGARMGRQADRQVGGVADIQVGRLAGGRACMAALEPF